MFPCSRKRYHKPEMRYTKNLSAFRILERLAQMSGRTLFVIWIFIVLAFAFAYFVLSTGDGHNGVTTLPLMENAAKRFANAVYFSVVTATTVGYGDMVPLGFSRVLAASEAALGFFLFAVVISKIVSGKQELALGNVHKLAFQEAFLKTREVLYLVRRDCDVIAAHARENKSLTEKLWSNLLIVFQKTYTVLEHIPDFYDDLYAIDARREKLLLDSVDRTLNRFVALRVELRSASVGWKDQEEIVAELQEFTLLAEEVVHTWRAQSQHGNDEWFTKIADAARELRKSLEA